MRKAAGLLILVGLLILIAGILMPDRLVTGWETVCLEYARWGECIYDERVTLTKRNDWKIPTIVGGAVVTLVGVALGLD